MDSWSLRHMHLTLVAFLGETLNSGHWNQIDQTFAEPPQTRCRPVCGIGRGPLATLHRYLINNQLVHVCFYSTFQQVKPSVLPCAAEVNWPLSQLMRLCPHASDLGSQSLLPSAPWHPISKPHFPPPSTLVQHFNAWCKVVTIVGLGNIHHPNDSPCAAIEGKI